MHHFKVKIENFSWEGVAPRPTMSGEGTPLPTFYPSRGLRPFVPHNFEAMVAPMALKHP